MRLSIVDLRDPTIRHDAAMAMADYTRNDVQGEDAYLLDFASRPHTRSIVARTESGEFMGFSMGTRAWSHWGWFECAANAARANYHQAWVIAELHVVPKFRRMRIGSMLLWDAECQSPHRDWAILGVDISNIPAIQLYRKCGWIDTNARFCPRGFTTTQMLFEKDLSDHPPLEFVASLAESNHRDILFSCSGRPNPPSPSPEHRPSPGSPEHQTA